MVCRCGVELHGLPWGAEADLNPGGGLQHGLQERA